MILNFGGRESKVKLLRKYYIKRFRGVTALVLPYNFYYFMTLSAVKSINTKFQGNIGEESDA